jgi:hypothetical protein
MKEYQIPRKDIKKGELYNQNLSPALSRYWTIYLSGCSWDDNKKKSKKTTAQY